MEYKDELQQGWDFMAQMLAAKIVGEEAINDFNNVALQNKFIDMQNDHIMQINDAIDQLEKNINEHPHINLDAEQFKGYVAEEMHAGAFNIDAIRKGSDHRAWTLQEHGYASPDIDTNFDKKYSLKYSNEAQKAENMQAMLHRDTGEPKYQGQERLIAAEQVDEAKKVANIRALKDKVNRPDVSDAHMDTKEHLVGKVTDVEGVESKELSIKEAKDIAKEAKKEGFKPEKHGFEKETAVENVKIDYINQAFKAGLKVASITAIIQIVPELYKAIDYLIKNGEIDVDEAKKSGKGVITSSGEAFLRGSAIYMIEYALSSGKFGEKLVEANTADAVTIIVMVVFEVIKDSIRVATGKMTPKEMGIKVADKLIDSSLAFVGMKAGMKVTMAVGLKVAMKIGVATQTLLPELVGVGYAIGALLGFTLSVAYNIGKKKLISFCVESGFTCFGLVDQNYELPDEVLNELGVDVVPIPRTEIERIEVPRTDVFETDIEEIKYETVDLTILRRGVIGVNKIGYVFD